MSSTGLSIAFNTTLHIILSHVLLRQRSLIINGPLYRDLKLRCWGGDCMPTKDACRAHRLQAQWAEVENNADRLAIGAALLARAAAAPETPSKGQVLSPTVSPQAQRV